MEKENIIIILLILLIGSVVFGFSKLNKNIAEKSWYFCEIERVKVMDSNEYPEITQKQILGYCDSILGKYDY